MRVYLESSVFAQAKEWCLPLMWFARVGRHRVLPAPQARVIYEAWKSGLTTTQQADVAQAEEWSTHEEASAASKLQLVVSEPPTATSTSVAQAWQILQRPYRILVEDGFNDTAFLLRMAGTQEREFLRHWIESEWVQPDHGGGISSMPRRARQLASQQNPLLASCIFDSDSSSPGNPSTDSETLEEACTANAIHHYRLQRRAIENYLPRSAYERWIANGRDRREKTRRRGLVDRFFALSLAERHHARVKDLVAPIGSLYDDDSAMNDQDLASEGGPAEVLAFISELIERIR